MKNLDVLDCLSDFVAGIEFIIVGIRHERKLDDSPIDETENDHQLAWEQLKMGSNIFKVNDRIDICQIDFAQYPIGEFIVVSFYL